MKRSMVSSSICRSSMARWISTPCNLGLSSMRRREQGFSFSTISFVCDNGIPSFRLNHDRFFLPHIYTRTTPTKKWPFEIRRGLSSEVSLSRVSNSPSSYNKYGPRERTKRRREALRTRRQNEKIKEIHRIASSLSIGRSEPERLREYIRNEIIPNFSESKITSAVDRLQRIFTCTMNGTVISPLESSGIDLLSPSKDNGLTNGLIVPLPIALVAHWYSKSTSSSSSNPGIETQILSFLLQFPGTTERRQQPRVILSEDIDCIIKARQRAFKNELHWNSMHRKEASEYTREQHLEIQDVRHGTVTANEEEQLRQAQAFLQEISSTLPTQSFISLIHVLQNYVEPLQPEKDITSGSYGPGFAMRTLSGTIAQAVGKLHFPLIARHVAEFFYTLVGQNSDIVEHDSNYQEGMIQLKSLEERMLHLFMNINDVLATSLEQNKANQSEIEILSNQTEDDLDLGNASSAPTGIGSVDRRFRKPVHVKFEATIMHEDAADSADSHSWESSQPNIASVAERMLFVDNLPIDMTVSKLRTIYERCGPIEHIKVLNQRPDLDPGALSAAKIARLKKKQLRRGAYDKKKYTRPRTPVYGQILFSDVESYKRALDRSLCTFGVIIERHPVQSIPAKDLKSLYIDNITGDMACSELEYALSRALHPDMLVSLRGGQNSKSRVRSCEIEFPSFEVAFESYDRLLRDFDQMEKPQNEELMCVHWMKTPKDAQEWWTRERGFY